MYLYSNFSEYLNGVQSGFKKGTMFFFNKHSKNPHGLGFLKPQGLRKPGVHFNKTQKTQMDGVFFKTL